MWLQTKSAVSIPLVPKQLSEPYYRLLPAGLDEAALVNARLAQATGLTMPVVDRTLCPQLDVLDSGILQEALLSKRLAQALLALNVPGVRVLGELTHATPNEVAGWPVMRVQVDGRAGELVGGVPAPSGTSFMRPGLGMRLDPASGDGAALGWTPWIGFVDPAFRHLVMRRELLLALIAHLGELRVAIEGIACDNDPGQPSSPPYQALAGMQPVAQASSTAAPAMSDLVDQLRAESKRAGHVLFLAHVEPPVARAHGDFPLLWQAIGPGRLFEGSLRFVAGPEARKLGSELADSDRALAASEAVIACSRGGDLLWVLNDADHVAGRGRDGVHYGPDVPLARWLSDQLDDIRFFRAHPAAPGAAAALSLG